MRIGDNLSAISIGLSLSILCIKVYLDRLNLEVLADSNTQYHDTIPIVINESAILIFIQIIFLIIKKRFYRFVVFINDAVIIANELI